MIGKFAGAVAVSALMAAAGLAISSRPADAIGIVYGPGKSRNAQSQSQQRPKPQPQQKQQKSRTQTR